MSQKAHRLISQAETVYVSSVSIWEATIKIALGKLEAQPEALMQEVAESGFTELSLCIHHIMALPKLPNLHRDPFDRILIAQAMSDSLKFLTNDTQLKAYSDIVELV